MSDKILKSSKEYRDLDLELLLNNDEVERTIDEETRTVTFSFSSEQPVVREYFDPDIGEFVRANEVLDHSGDVRLERLKTAGSLFVNHDKTKVAGVVEDAWVDTDRGRGSVRVRFGRSNYATEIFNDVKDGIRRTVSFGYRVLEAVMRDVENDIPTMLVRAWEPFEVSLETLPADITVGVGRSENEDDDNEFVVRTETLEIETPEEEPSVPEITIKEDRTMSENTFENGIKAERKRLNGIAKIADSVRHLLPSVDELAEEFKNSERTLDEFNAAIVAKMDSVRMDKLENAPTQEVDLTEKEERSYSLMRLGNALASGDWREAGFELEVSRAQADINGQDARGAFVPLSILARADAAQAGVTAPNTFGAGLVPTDFWGNEYIDVLRANSVVAGMGARILPGLVGDVDIPKALSEGSFSWLTEGGDNYASTSYSSTTVALKPKDIGGALGYTRKMMKQTGNPAIENLLRDSLNSGISAFLDKQALVGTDSDALGINSVADFTSASTALAWYDIVKLETEVATENAELGSLGYITSPAVRGIMKGKVKDSSGAGGFLMADGGSVNGYKCAITTNANTSLFYGNWNDLLIPMWGGIDLMVDTATKAHTGGVVLRAFLATDIAVRHAESFAVMSGITS